MNTRHGLQPGEVCEAERRRLKPSAPQRSSRRRIGNLKPLFPRRPSGASQLPARGSPRHRGATPRLARAPARQPCRQDWFKRRDAKACLLDHLICQEKQGRRHRNSQRLGGLEVDDRLKLQGLPHGEGGWFGTFWARRKGHRVADAVIEALDDLPSRPPPVLTAGAPPFSVADNRPHNTDPRHYDTGGLFCAS
jgi:hypothetical protein